MLNKIILLEGLKEFANKDLQQKLWVYGNKEQMSSFEEACCAVFDDSGLTKAIDSGYLKTNFSEELCNKVNQFDRLLDLLPTDTRPEDVINHPKMDEARELANELLNIFTQEMPS